MDAKTTLQTAWLGTVEYEQALQPSGRDGRGAPSKDAIGDTLLLLEHPHVYTLGRGAAERLPDSAASATSRFTGSRAAGR